MIIYDSYTGSVICTICKKHNFYANYESDCPKCLEKKINMLRQWLNEDRITDPKKMVTNQDLEYWLVED